MNAKIIFGTAAALLALSIVGHFDNEEEIASDRTYCEMVDLNQQFNHLPPPQRPGWPTFRDDIDCRDYGFSHAYRFSNA